MKSSRRTTRSDATSSRLGLLRPVLPIAALFTALFATGGWFVDTAEAYCPEIDVQVTLANSCQGQGWVLHTIEELESITSIPIPNESMECSGNSGGACEVAFLSGNLFRSRYCAGATTVVTGPAAECEEPPGGAVDIGLSNAPLFLTASVEPNIMFLLDDSGSMFFEVTPDDLAFPGSSYAGFVFPRANNTYGPSDYPQDFIQTATVDSNVAYTAITRSPQFNSTYYNPSITYTPWIRADGTLYPNASPTCAFHNPERTGDCPGGSVNQYARNLTVNNGRYNSNRWRTCTSTGACSTSTDNKTFWPATYFWHDGGNEWNWTNYTRVEIRSSAQTYEGHNRDWRTDCTAGTCTYAQELQNFANWYTYYRSRILAARAGIGQAFSLHGDGMRVGFGTINSDSNTVDNVSTSTIIHGVRPFIGDNRDTFYDELYTRDIPALGTPLRKALDDAGQYFSRTDSRGPWSSTPGESDGTDLECRQAYTILMTDGYWSGGSTHQAGTSSARQNNDNTAGPTISNPSNESYQYLPADPYRDDRGNTLADVAMYYWKRDLRTDIDNLVPTHPKNEAFWQHMVTFGVGLGVFGSIEPDDAWSAVADGTAITWPDPNIGTANCSGSECPARIDDLLHAAVNSRGGFFSAADPDTFAAELSDVLDAIVARVDTSANSAASSSAVLQSDTLLYTAGFRSGDWSGALSARKINNDGSLEPAGCAACWNAETLLAARSSANRNLHTRNADTGSGVSLQWNNLDSDQKAALGRNPGNTTDGLGEQRLDWLRGTEHNALRSRMETGQLRLLGDFIYSDPQFKNNVLYLGGNDGMLHAFDGSTGEELFGYIPTELLLPEPGRNHAPLSRLMDPAYSHRFFMDGTVTVADITIDGTPKTYVIGGMGAGGRTVFALDVTSLGDVDDPQPFSAADVKWEFTDPELGYRASTPAVVRMNDADGTWAAIFGNGYNSASGKASLFIVNIETGALIKRIDTDNETANGLSGVFVTDWPARDLRANRIYAGDLKGRLWAFDVSGGPDQWTNANNRRVLFEAEDPDGNPQPISSRPFGASFDDDHVIIAFGTGSYFRNQDKDDEQVQSLYGIIDVADPGNNFETIGKDELLQQEIIAEVTPAVGNPGADMVLRFISNYELERDSPDPEDDHKGWFIDLGTEAGERVINGPRAFGREEQRVRFTTLIPDEDPCGSGRRGFLMDIGILSGARLEVPVFDLNGDFEFTNTDKIIVNGAQLPPSGIGFGTGESPVVIDVRPSGASGSGDYQLICDGEGNCEVGRPADITVGRQSWMQAR